MHVDVFRSNDSLTIFWNSTGRNQRFGVMQLIVVFQQSIILVDKERKIKKELIHFKVSSVRSSSKFPL